jgi:nucleoside 2-deoxyribosyltransferase
MNIFLSAPLTQYTVAPETSGLEAFQTHWSRIMEALERNGHKVFSAHRREAWGTELDSPADALAADLAGLRASDLVIAYVGSPASPGVQLELGYSLARKIPAVVFADAGQPGPYLLRGLPAVSDSHLHEISSLGEIQPVLVREGLIAAGESIEQQ